MDTSTSTTQANLDPMDEIASLLSDGGDEQGEVEPSPEKQTQETEDTQDPEAVEDETEELTESEEENESDSDNEHYESEEYQDLLADAFGVDSRNVLVDDEGNVSVKVKVDGEESTQSMKDLIAGFQFKKHNDRKSQALAEERKKFDAEAKDTLTKYQQSIERNAALAEILQEEFMAEYKAIDWEDLKSYDPGGYAAKQIDFNNRYGQLQNLDKIVTEQKETFAQEQGGKAETARNEYLTEQRKVMLEHNPSWSDSEVFKQAMGDLRGFLGDTYGFTPENLDAVTDARLIELSKDAMAYRNGSKVAEKKVKKVPKIQKTSSPRKRVKMSKLDKLTNAARKAKGSRKRDLEVDAVASLLLGD